MSDTMMYSKHDNVRQGTMVAFSRSNSLVYAGPLKDAPVETFPEGSLLLLHPEDYDRLKDHVEKRRH